MTVLSLTPLPTRPGGRGGFIQWYTSKTKYLGRHTSKGNPYPCLTCDGDKRIIHPDAVPDVIEGHKMSERITCPFCSGTGRWTMKQYRDIYRSEVAEWSQLYALAYRTRVLESRALHRMLKGMYRSDLNLLGITVPEAFHKYCRRHKQPKQRQPRKGRKK